MKIENRGFGQRYAWLDMAKGYGMLLVIWAHLVDDGTNGWVYSFHMPLFFFLSGYVFHTKYAFGDFLKRKVKTMIVPYFCLGVPMVLFELLRYCFTGGVSVGSVFYLFGCLIAQNRFWTLWYLASLFWLNILFYFLAKRVKSEWILLGISMAMAVAGVFYYSVGGTSLPWNVDVCLTASPFFALGHCYHLHHEKVDAYLFGMQSEETASRTRWKTVGAFVLFAVVNVICNGITWWISGMGLEMFYNKYGSPVFTYVSAVAGIACMVILAKQWTLTPVRYIGENSMLYYAWHQTIMIPIVTGFLMMLGWRVYESDARWEIILYKILCVLLILAITTVCDYIIKKLGWKFALGK